MTKNELKHYLAEAEVIISEGESQLRKTQSKSKRVRLAEVVCRAYASRGSILNLLREPYRSLERDQEAVLPLEKNTTTNTERSENIFSSNVNLWKYHGEGKNEESLTSKKTNKTKGNNNMKAVVLRHEGADGVEFFTVEATGESGMSVSGLARLCGRDRKTVSEVIQKAVGGNSTSKSLKPLQGKEIQLAVGASHKNVSVIKDEVCACVIKHYAYSGSELAQLALDRFIEKGVRAWIQDITGWSRKPAPAMDFSQMPQTFLELAEAWVGQLQENQKLLAEVVEVKKLNQDLKDSLDITNSFLETYSVEHNEMFEELLLLRPKARSYDLCINLDEWVTGSELARRLSRNLKSSKIGVPTLYKVLRENGALIKYEGSNINLPSELWVSKGLLKFDGTPLFSPRGCVQALIVFKQDKYACLYPELRDPSINPEESTSTLSFLD